MRRCWRQFDLNSFLQDLRHSELVRELQCGVQCCDVNELVAQYDETMRVLIDAHVPLKRVPIRAAHRVCWYDADCRQMKKETRRLEKHYRFSKSPDDRERWRTQFSQQRQMFQDKLRQYWLTTINECRNDPKALWTKVQRLLSVPSFGHQSELSVEDLSSHFVSKVDRIRTVTAGAARPVINARMTSSMAAFQPVNPEEIQCTVLV